MIGSKFSRHFFQPIRSETKPIVARACTFCPALCRLRVITSIFDWFTGLSPSFLIGQSNYFGFGFTTRLKLALTLQVTVITLQTYVRVCADFRRHCRALPLLLEESCADLRSDEFTFLGRDRQGYFAQRKGRQCGLVVSAVALRSGDPGSRPVTITN